MHTELKKIYDEQIEVRIIREIELFQHLQKQKITRMWADTQRDGRPAEYRWHPLQKIGNSIIPFLVPRRKVWLTPAAGVPCSNAANVPERKTWT